jgi:hypothetical protein
MSTKLVRPNPSGRYAFNAYGQLLPGNPHIGPVAWAGFMQFDGGTAQGTGTVKGTDTVNYADESPVKRNFTGTFKVEDDYSVTVTLFDGSASLTLCFGDSNKQFLFVQTDLFRVASGRGIKVG